MRQIDVPPKIKYIRELFAPEDQLLESTRKCLSTFDWPINIGAEEGKLLQLLMHLHQTKRAVEVGTHAGYSTLWLARALPEDGFLHTIERDKRRAAMAAKTIAASEVASKIKLHIDDALMALNGISSHGPFDMIFIDADKINYLAYLDWAEQNIRSGGLIIGDNTFLFDAVFLKELPKGVVESTRDIMRKFNQRLADSQKYHSIMLPTKEGITIAIKK